MNSYNTQIGTIDQQHKKLVEMINNLESAIGKNGEQKIIGEIFYQLVDYTKYHFSFEERLMAESSYPQLKEHIILHKEFIDQIVLMLEAMKTDSHKLGDKLITFLKDWLLQHILGHDKEFGAFYKMSMNSND